MPNVQQMLIDAVRGKQNLGYLGMLSGDRVLAPLGEEMSKESVANLKQASEAETAEGNRRVLQNYYNSLGAHMQNQDKYNQDQLAELRRYHDLLLEIAKIKKTGGKPIPATIQSKMEELGQVNQALDDLLNKTPYQEKWVSSIPGMRPLKNAIARNAPAFASQDDIDANEWQRKFNDTIRLVKQHGLYGGALTPSEIANFALGITNFNQNKAQVDKYLKEQQKITLGHMRRLYEGGVNQGYDSDAILGFMGLGDIGARGAAPQEDDQIPYEVLGQ